jgi:hypothetical protein
MHRVLFFLVGSVLFLIPIYIHAHAFPRIITIDEKGIRPLSIALDDDTAIVIENTTTIPAYVIFEPSHDSSHAAQINPIEIAPDSEWFPDISTDKKYTYFLKDHPGVQGTVTIERSDIPTLISLPWYTRIWQWIRSWWSSI